MSRGSLAMPHASVRPREPRIPMDDVVLGLCDATGLGSHADTRSVVDRIIHLATEGENATSIMRRLNPPAIVDPERFLFPRTEVHPDGPEQIVNLFCRECRCEWKRKKQPGRIPAKCPACSLAG